MARGPTVRYVKDYAVQELLGKGAFGSVFRQPYDTLFQVPRRYLNARTGDQLGDQKLPKSKIIDLRQTTDPIRYLGGIGTPHQTGNGILDRDPLAFILFQQIPHQRQLQLVSDLRIQYVDSLLLESPDQGTVQLGPGLTLRNHLLP